MKRLRKPTVPVLAAVVTMSVGSVGMTGCSSEPQATSGAPPTVVCGTVLSDSVAGAVVYDATRPLRIVRDLTVGGVLIFRVARGCDAGTHVTWTPASAAHLVKAVSARDGQTAAVVLKPARPHAAFRLIATRDGRVVASAVVKLAS